MTYGIMLMGTGGVIIVVILGGLLLWSVVDHVIYSILKIGGKSEG